MWPGEGHMGNVGSIGFPDTLVLDESQGASHFYELTRDATNSRNMDISIDGEFFASIPIRSIRNIQIGLRGASDAVNIDGRLRLPGAIRIENTSGLGTVVVTQDPAHSLAVNTTNGDMRDERSLDQQFPIWLSR